MYRTDVEVGHMWRWEENLTVEILRRVRRLSIPVIAEVFGLAAAAGCQLVASCDIVVAGENASFSVPGVKHG